VDQRTAAEKHGEILANLAERIVPRQVEYSSLVNITTTGRTEDDAIKLANQTATAYQDYTLEVSTQRTREARNFIQGQLDTVRTKLDSLQAKLEEFRTKSLPYSTAEMASLQTLVNRRQMVNSQLLSLREQQRRLEAGTRTFGTEGTSLDVMSGSPYSASYVELNLLYANRRELLRSYTEESEQVRALDERIAELSGDLLISLRQDEELIGAQLAEIMKALDSFPGEEVKLAELNRQVGLNSQLLTQLETSLQEVRIQEAEQVEEVSIVDFASTAQADRQSGRGIKTFIGLMLGLMLGFVISFVLESLDTSIGTIEDVEEYLELPVLAVIPHLDVDRVAARLVKESPQLEEDPDLEKFARLLTQYDPKSPAAEAYRTLRTNLDFARAGAMDDTPEGRGNAFVFTSSSLQEGKTTTIVNLAIVMAQAGNRVLLLGCNMRRPTIYKSFGLKREKGMTDVLTGQAEWRECIKTVTDMMVGPLSVASVMSMPGLDNLHIITAGGVPPNPSELLNTPRFGELINEAREEFDFILVDAPPILPVTDAAVIGRQVDWSVLLYQVGKVPRNALRRARSHVGSKVIGIAMNDVRAEIGGYSPYSHYLTKYYGEDVKEARTLLQRVAAWFGMGKKVDEKDEEEIEPFLSEPVDEGSSGWIDIDYFDNGDPEGGGPGQLPYARGPLPTDEERDEESAEPGEDKDGGSDSDPPEKDEGKEKGRRRLRIPLWGWLALAVIAIVLVILTLLGWWGQGSSEASVALPETSFTVPVEAQSGSSPASSPSSGISRVETPATRPTLIWAVQVGSYRTAVEAEAFIKALRNADAPGADQAWSREEENDRLGRWHRVYIGQFEDWNRGEQLAEELRESGAVALALVKNTPPLAP
jgi:capsular exopolysaccharide synthesis family protein